MADAEAGSREAEQKLAEAQQHLQRDMFQVKSDLLQEQLQKVKGELVDSWRDRRKYCVRPSRLIV